MGMPEELNIAATLAETTRELAGEADLDAALKLIIDLATESIVCDSASITLRLSGGRFHTLAPTGENVRRADSLQYELNEGPCVAATWTDGMFLVEDLLNDPRFPNWGPRAAALGMHSILSLHLYTTKQSVGALNLYGTQSHRYTDLDVEMARVVAAHASAALARLRIEQDLWTAIDSRHLIGQAQGILMGKLDISTEQAFAVLQRYSKHTNRKLRDVAEDIIQTRKLPDTSTMGHPRRT